MAAGDAEAAGAAALAIAAGAAGEASWAKAGIAIAAAKKAAERTERVRFILWISLDIGSPLMGRIVTISVIAIPVPSRHGKIPH